MIKGPLGIITFLLTRIERRSVSFTDPQSFVQRSMIGPTSLRVAGAKESPHSTHVAV